MTVLPQDPDLRQVWVDKIARDDWTPDENSALCEVILQQRIKTSGLGFLTWLVQTKTSEQHSGMFQHHYPYFAAMQPGFGLVVIAKGYGSTLKNRTTVPFLCTVFMYFLIRTQKWFQKTLKAELLPFAKTLFNVSYNIFV